MSRVKSAQWLSMYRMKNLHKRDHEKFIKHHHKIRLFQNNRIPIHVNFSRRWPVGVFFGLGILGWQNLKSLKNLKAYYYNEKRLFSPIIRAQLYRSIKSFKIMTTINKSRSKYFLFMPSYAPTSMHEPLSDRQHIKILYLHSPSGYSIDNLKINFTSICKDKLRPTQPSIIAAFNQQQFPCRSDFLRFTKINDFLAHHQYLKRIKKIKTYQWSTSLTFSRLGKQLLKNDQSSSFLKFSIVSLLTSFKQKKKNLLGLSSKPKSQNLMSLPKKTIVISSVKPQLFSFTSLNGGLRPKNYRLNFFKISWPIRHDSTYGSTKSREPVSDRLLSLLFKPDNSKQWLSENQWSTLKTISPRVTDYQSAAKNNSNKNFREWPKGQWPVTKTSHLTYSSEFYIPVQIIDQISKKMYLRWLLLADLPIQTKRGHFIINGYPKTVIHQIVRSPGIRFKNEDNQILADIISMRGAWMGIQIVYEKNLKAANVGLKSHRKKVSDFETFWPITGSNMDREAASHVVSNLAKREQETPNKITNKSMLQHKPENLYQNLGLTLGETMELNHNLNRQWPGGEKNFNMWPVSHHNITSRPVRDFQSSRYLYQTNFLQNAIMKSEKIDHLPVPTLSLLKAKPENKANQKFKHWPGAFFCSKPIDSFQAANKNQLHLDKSKKPYTPFSDRLLSSVKEISTGSLKQKERHDLGSIKHHFGHFLFWTSSNYKNKPLVHCLISLLMIKSGLNNKPATRPLTKLLSEWPVTPKLFKLTGHVLPLNSIKERQWPVRTWPVSEKIHEALSINFFISSSRTDNTDKKRIKLSGFAFLNYLFDHPYFVYNNYIPSLQKSSFFPASVLMKDTVDASLFEKSYRPLFLKKNVYTKLFSSFKRPLDYGLVSEKLWPFFQNQTHSHHLIKGIGLYNFYTNKNTEAYPYSPEGGKQVWSNGFSAKDNYLPYFTTNDTFLKNLTWRFLKKIKHTRFSKRWPCLIQESSFKTYPLLNDLNRSKALSLLDKSNDSYSLASDKPFYDRPVLSLLVPNTNQKKHGSFLSSRTISNFENFTIQASNLYEKIHGINNKKLPMIKTLTHFSLKANRWVTTQNQNASLWVTTPIINKGAPNIGWGTQKNMYKKYLNAMKNHSLMISSNEILRKKFIHRFSYLPYPNQDNHINLRVLQKNHNGFLDDKSTQESQLYVDKPYTQPWTSLFTNKLIQSEKIISSNQLLASLVSMCGLNLIKDIILSI